MDPVTAFIVACVFAWHFTRTVFEGTASARGREPHTATHRHAERMQRMQHRHERWMARAAEKRELRQQGHGTIGRAVQNRIAKWVENAGKRSAAADEAMRVHEEKVQSSGRRRRFRTAWLNARQYSRQWHKLLTERAAHRFATSPRMFTRIDTEDEPQVDEQATERPDEPPMTEKFGGAPEYMTSERLDEPKQLESAPTTTPVDDVIDAEVVEPETTASPEAEEPPSNVIPFTRGAHSMSEPIQTLTLGSGETINPETGIAFAEGLSAIYDEMGARIQASIANLSQAGVADDQIAKLTEMLNLNEAAKGKAVEMGEHFTDHQNAQQVVAAAGAGTNAGYLG